MGITWEETEQGLRVTIPKPEKLDNAKWEKIIIRLARNFGRLDIKVRRVNNE